MDAKGPQQIVQANHGGVIENVVQIIQGDKPDVTFSSDSARPVPNRIHRESALSAVRSELGKHLWRPPDIDDALADIEVQGWSVPLWRLRGKVSATWTEWREEVVSKTEDKEQKQWVPDQGRTTQDLDWLVPAHRATNSTLRALSEAIETLNRAQQAVRVDWQGYRLGELLEQMWPNLKAAYGGLPWQRKSAVASARTLFADPVSDRGRENSAPAWLSKLEPETSLLTAINRADRQIEDHLRSWASKFSKRLADFRLKLDVDSVEQYWFPIWVAQYAYHGTQHSVVINGYNARPVNAPLPLSFRAGFIAWSIVTLFLTVLFWPYAAYLFYQALFGFSSELKSFAFFNALIALFFALIPFLITGLLVLIWWVQRHWLSE